MNTPDFYFHCVAGPLFVSLVGSGLHFAYHASGCNAFVALFAAVNESLYEHLKLLITALLVWWLAITPCTSMPRNSKLLALTASVSTASVSGCVFISLTFFIEEHKALWIDILLFVAAACIAQYAGWLVFEQFFVYDDDAWYELPIIAPAAALFVMYLLFTYFPPHIDIVFQDASNASNKFYGVSHC